MKIWVKPRFHTHTECGQRFHPLLHISYIKGLLVSPIKWRCLHRVLCLIRMPITTSDSVLLKNINLVFVERLGPKISFRACLWVLLRLHHITKCLLIHTAFYLSFYILPKDLQGWLRSCKILNRTVSCEFVGGFISSYPSMSRDPIQSHYAPGRDIQRLLALSYQ